MLCLRYKNVNSRHFTLSLNEWEQKENHDDKWMSLKNFETLFNFEIDEDRMFFSPMPGSLVSLSIKVGDTVHELIVRRMDS